LGLNRCGVGKIGDVQTISRRISETNYGKAQLDRSSNIVAIPGQIPQTNLVTPGQARAPATFASRQRACALPGAAAHPMTQAVMHYISLVLLLVNIQSITSQRTNERTNDRTL